MSLLKKLLNIDSPKKINRKRIFGDVLGKVKLQVKIDGEWDGKMVGFPLKNISQNGLAFTPDTLSELFIEGKEYKAYIDCAGESIPFQFVVVHKRNFLIGCRVISNNIDFGLLIKKYFKLELAAIESSQIPSAKLNKDPDGTPYWICSPENCELYYVLNEQTGVAKYHIGVFGNFIVRGKEKVIGYKEITSGEATYTAYKGTDLLKDVNDEFPKDQLIKNALSYIALLDDLPENVKELIRLELEQALQNL